MNFVSNKKSIISFAAVVVLSFFSQTVFAVWNGTFYDPGDTLNPECLPTDVDCDVRSPLTAINIDDTVYGVSWDTDTTHAPSKNALYDKIEGLVAGSHDILTLGTANGLSLVNQVLSLALASSTTTGALSNTDWNTFNNKQNALTADVDYLTPGTATSTYVPYTGGTTNVDLGVHNLTVDTNSLFVDSVNHRVGIGTTAPLAGLHVGTGGTPGSTGANDVYIQNDLEVDGTIYGNISGTINPGFTSGSVVFQGGSGLAEDNANLFWDDTNNRLGIGITNPLKTLDVVGTIQAHKTESSEQDNILKILSTASTSASDANWRGRAMFGAQNLTTIMGVYRNQSIIGTHSWTSADSETGAAWDNLYLNWDAVGNAGGNVLMKGNVGIGTTAPKLALHVFGQYGAPASSGTTPTGIAMFANQGANNLYFGANSTSPYGLWMQASDATDLSLTYPILLNPRGGNVGIGTTTPTANFQVAQGTSGVGTVSTTATSTTVSGVGTQFLNTFKVNDTITVNGETRTISAIASNTSMTTDAWTGSNTGVAYTLVGGTRFSVSGNGQALISDGINSVPGIAFASQTNLGFRKIDSISIGVQIANLDFSKFNSTGIQLYTTGSFGWGSGLVSTTKDLLLTRGAAATLQLGAANTTTAGVNQTLRTQGAITTADTAGGSLTIQTGVGTGAAVGAPIYFATPDAVASGTTAQTASTKMTILGNGNVGIGTTGPATLLQVSNKSGGTVERIAYFTNENIGNSASQVKSLFLGVGNGTAYATGFGELGMIMGNGSVQNALEFSNNKITFKQPTYIANNVSINSSSTDIGASVQLLKFNTSNNLEIGPKYANTSNYGVDFYISGTGGSYQFYNRSTGPTSLLTILGTGNVGIGTTSPTAKLDVDGGNINVGTNQGYYFRGISGLGLENDGAYGLSMKSYDSIDIRMDSNNNDADTQVISFSKNAGTELMRIQENGNVGIGTTAPAVKLDIASSAGSTSDSALRFTYTDGPTAYYHNDITNLFSGNAALHTMNFVTTSNSVTLTPLTLLGNGNVIMNAGNVGIGTTAPTEKLEIAGGSVRVSGQAADFNAGVAGLSIDRTGTNNRIYTVSGAGGTAGTLTLGTNNSAAVTILDGGNVGIGTTAPLYKLDVQGVDGTTSFAVRQESTQPVFDIVPVAGAGGLVRVLDNGGTSAVQFTAYGDSYFNAGNIGIGTTTPTSRIHGVTTLSAATGDEIAYQLNYTTNKGTSGNDTGLLINMTDTASPGLSLPLNIKVGSTSIFNINQIGAATFGNSVSATSFYSDNATSTNFRFRGTGSGNPNLDINSDTVPANGSHNFIKMRNASAFPNTSGTVNFLSITPLYNQASGTSANTDLLINRTETSVGSGAQYLINAGTGGGTYVSKFSVSNTGQGYFAGNVGIGTTAPTRTLSVAGNASFTGNGVLFQASSGTDGLVDANGNLTAGGYFLRARNSGTEYFRVDYNGNVGIGDTTPDALLDVKGTVCLDLNADDVCTDNTSALSDSRLKTDVIELKDSLELVRQLRPVRFTWNGLNNTGNADSLGFLAQEVEAIFPELVLTDTAGYKNLDYSKLTAVLAGSIQELDLNINALSGTITPLPGSSNESFVTAFFDNLFAKITTWLADAGNGIGSIFAGEVDTKSLCVSDDSGEKTCITKAQLDALLLNATMPVEQSASPSPSEPAPEPTPEQPAPTEEEPAPEPVPEPTPEITPEPEPEVVPEPTLEPAPEPEPTPEPSPEPPVSLDSSPTLGHSPTGEPGDAEPAI